MTELELKRNISQGYLNDSIVPTKVAHETLEDQDWALPLSSILLKLMNKL